MSFTLRGEINDDARQNGFVTEIYTCAPVSRFSSAAFTLEEAANWLPGPHAP